MNERKYDCQLSKMVQRRIPKFFFRVAKSIVKRLKKSNASVSQAFLEHFRDINSLEII